MNENNKEDVHHWTQSNHVKRNALGRYPSLLGEIYQAFPNLESIFIRFQLKQKADIWDEVLKCVSLASDKESVMIDATSVLVHQYGLRANGAKKKLDLPDVNFSTKFILI